jgi:hypothetical protein
MRFEMLQLMSVLAISGAALAGPTDQDTSRPRTADSVLGLDCSVQSKAELEALVPGLKLPAKQYIVVRGVTTRRFADESSLGEGDLLVKVGGRSVADIEDLTAVLEKLELPGDVKVEYLDVTAGAKPKLKRESIVVKAVMPTAPKLLAGDSTGRAESASQPVKAEAKFDKFKNITRVHLPDQRPAKAKYEPAEFEFSFSAIFDGPVWKKRPTVRIVITSSDQRWRFIDVDRTLYLIIDDGKPEELLKPSYSSEIMSGTNFCWEYMSWELSTELFDRLCAAKKVECKVSIVEFELPSTIAGRLTDFAKVVDGLSEQAKVEATDQPK